MAFSADTNSPGAAAPVPTQDCTVRILAPANAESGRPFFGNPAKSYSGQISSRIWRMPVQLQYVQLIMDKTNAADLSSCIFAILISDPNGKKYNSRSTNFVKNWQAVM